jgi:stage II sporulation protein D
MRTRLTAILLAAIVLPAVAAVPAQGASRLVVRGAGFGHGVGMSQYGAFGFANQGKDHAFILNHYYAGTQLAKLSGETEVRVLLRNAGRIAFRGAAGVAGGRRLDPAQTYYASRALGDVTLRSAGGRDLGTYAAPLRISGAEGVRVLGPAVNDVTDGVYRGDLEVRPAALGVAAINVVRLEDYVRGVVPGEVPTSWPVEALRAQAVAARTYAMATRKDGDGFDQYADTRSQMYPGKRAEVASTNAAVAATAGEVVAYQGKPIVTYYFSTSGGRTENVENSFLGAEPQPYLTSVADPYDGASPRHRWIRRLTLASAGRRLGGLVKGELRQIRVLRRGRSPRVVRAQVVGTGGTTNVTGPRLRTRLGLYDTWARFTVITSRGARGDGNTPRSSGQTPSGPTGSGGAAPGGGTARAAASIALLRGEPTTVAGTISGRVEPAIAGRQIVVERYDGARWIPQSETLTRVAGRYRANVSTRGLYRVRYGGEAGPAVRIR